MIDLTKQKLVLILGAGASRDYGFPLWDDLKTILMEQKQASNLGWPDILDKNHDKTIDQILVDLEDRLIENYQELIFNNFLKLEKKVLELPAVRECRDWIFRFVAHVFEDQINDPNVLRVMIENLSIINLNYDRVFDFLFTHHLNSLISSKHVNRFIRAEYERKLENSSEIHLRCIHPHGVLGRLPDSKNINSTLVVPNVVSYSGSKWEFGESVGVKRDINGYQIFPIDIVKILGNLEPYSHANKALALADSVYFFGVSETGINSSLLEIPNSADVHYVAPPIQSGEGVNIRDEIYSGDCKHHGHTLENFLTNLQNS